MFLNSPRTTTAVVFMHDHKVTCVFMLHNTVFAFTPDSILTHLAGFSYRCNECIHHCENLIFMLVSSQCGYFMSTKSVLQQTWRHLGMDGRRFPSKTNLVLTLPSPYDCYDVNMFYTDLTVPVILQIKKNERQILFLRYSGSGFYRIGSNLH